MRKFLKEDGNKVSAIFGSSDWVAIAALKAIQDLGLKVPEDYSVVGFDNLMISSIFSPRLTTHDQPKYRMGVKATQILLDLLKDKKPKEKEYLIESKGLIIRDSCQEYRK